MGVPSRPDVGTVVRQTLRYMAAQDWLLVGYFAAFFLAIALGSGPNRGPQLARIAADVSILGAGLVATRGQLLKPGLASTSLIYRLTIFGTVFLSYFQLQHILPAVSSRAVDASIFALDMKVFGFEPAVAWDRFVSPTTTEWFAFFYFGYFFLLTVHVIPFLLVARDTRLTAKFSLGIYIVFCSAHLLYIAVPGFGPYRYLASSFHHELRGGLFWRLVVDAVTGAGAQKDIFPSLHTAAPTYFVLFSIRHRARLPFKYTWPVLAFFVSQIIIATMFLRWHYLIDICAGLTLATFALVVSTRVEEWEDARRRRLDLPPVFEAPPLRTRWF